MRWYDALTAVTVARPTGSPVSASVTRPVSSPTSPIGEAATAAWLSSRPSPQTLLSPGVPPQVRSSMSAAVSSRISRVAEVSPTSAGATDHIRAAVAATWGAAIDVPLLAA